jgi:hypothetical protein
MAAPTRGLTPADIGAIREQLDAGRRPRVVFTESAGQIAGQQGHVVGMTDPAGSDEWIVVQFGRDELPFAPVDLATPSRSAAKATSPAGPAKRVPAARIPEGPPLKLAEPPAKQTRKANGTAPSAMPPPAPAPVAPTPPAAASSNGTKEPAKAAKPKAPASLTVTLSYADREWTIAATMGAKTLAKPYVIRPTDALRLVALVDVPGVHEAVENIMVAERAEAEGRAARLRTELAEIESRLAELAART